MNLLQNLWNLLITENELYTNIITIPLTFLEVLITALIFTSILDIKYSKKQMVIYVITFSIFANIFCFAIPAPYNSIFNLILSPILVFISPASFSIFKASWTTLLDTPAFSASSLVVIINVLS